MDVVDRETRSRMMSGIGSRNTKPELLIRKRLFSLGFRYRINNKKLAGSPDIVLPKYHAVIFIHGCFWHGHDCDLFKLPVTELNSGKKKSISIVRVMQKYLINFTPKAGAFVSCGNARSRVKFSCR